MEGTHRTYVPNKGGNHRSVLAGVSSLTDAPAKPADRPNPLAVRSLLLSRDPIAILPSLFIFSLRVSSLAPIPPKPRFVLPSISRLLLVVLAWTRSMYLLLRISLSLLCFHVSSSPPSLTLLFLFRTASSCCPFSFFFDFHSLSLSLSPPCSPSLHFSSDLSF